jgi:hypothetical protein
MRGLTIANEVHNAWTAVESNACLLPNSVHTMVSVKHGRRSLV